jgi:hypothetical protein
VAFCTFHGRRGEGRGRFVGWEQAYRNATSDTVTVEVDDAVGTDAGGVRVGSTDVSLTAAGGISFRGGEGGAYLFEGTYSGRLTGVWPPGGSPPAPGTTVVTCIAAGIQPRPAFGSSCMVPFALA